MAKPALVSVCVTDDSGDSEIYQPTPGNAVSALGPSEASPPPPEAGVDGFEGVRRSLKEQQVSSRAANIILQSWRSGTKKQYNVHLKKWAKFCCKRKINSLQASVGNALDFLTDLFEAGRSYSTINTARSALSTMLLVDGRSSFGTHPLVIRFMKGVYNARPPVSRYIDTWDVNIVIKFLLKLSLVKDLSTKNLTLKLCMLMALITGQRVQTLHLLELSGMKQSIFGFSFTLQKVLKHSRGGKGLPTLVFKAYPKDRRLCVITVLKEYLFRRKARVSKSENSLFVSYNRPFKSVTASTISRWIKTVLCQAGIDTNVYKAHSTRAASCSKAQSQDLPISDILKAGGWSNAKTFGTFYSKPVETRSFAEAVLKL